MRIRPRPGNNALAVDARPCQTIPGRRQARDLAERGLRCRPRLRGVRDERKPCIGGKLEALVRQGDVVDHWVVHPLGPRPLEAHIVARPRDAAPHQISLVVSNGNDGVLGYTLESARG